MKLSLKLLVVFILAFSCDDKKANISNINNPQKTLYKTYDSSAVKESLENLKKGEEFYFKGEIDSAIPFLEKSINLKFYDSEDLKIKYAEATEYLYDIYREMEMEKEGITLLEEFIKYSKQANDYPQDAVVSVYSSITEYYFRKGEIEKAISTSILPAKNIIKTELEGDLEIDALEIWKFLELNNLANYLRAAELQYDYEKQNKILNEIESKLFNFTTNSYEVKSRLFMIYNALIEYLLRAGEYTKAEIYISNCKQLDYPKPIIEEILLEDKYLTLYNTLDIDSLKVKAQNNIIELYNQVEDKKYYHEHYYIKVLNNIVYNKEFIENTTYSILDSITSIIENKFKFQQQNIYTNPASVYNSKFNFFILKDNLDSAKYHLNKHLKLVEELKHPYEILRHYQNKATYFAKSKNTDSLIETSKLYLSSKGISSINDVTKKDKLYAFDHNNILVNGKLAEKSWELYKLNQNLNLLKISNKFWLSNLVIFKNLNIDGRLNSNEKKLMLTARKNALKTTSELLKRNQEVDLKIIIEIIENSYNYELISEANNKFNFNKNKTIKALNTERLGLKSRLKTLSLKANDSLLYYENKLREVKNKIGKVSSAYANIFDFEFSSITDINEKLLRFYETDSLIYLFELTSEKAELVRTFNLDSVKAKINYITSNVNNKMDLKRNWDLNLSRGPIKVISNSVISSVPLELLFDTNDNNTSYNSSLAFLVNPNQTSKISLLSFNPSYKSTDKLDEKSKVRSGMYEIPYSSEETIYINQLFKGKLFFDNNATKENYLKNASNYNIHHLAMHAVVDEDDNYNASLLFQGTKEEDYLQLNEIYNLNIDADLVTLSACNTAYGKIDPVEGALSLSRAFQYAGAKATLTSLWRVPDRETSIIMKSFYTHLKDGKRKDVALKLAKDDYLNAQVEEQFKHPYYWAGFILTGDTSPIVNPTPWWIWALVSLAIILLSIFILKRNKKVS